MDPKDSQNESGRTVEIFPPIEVRVVLPLLQQIPIRPLALVAIGNPVHRHQLPTHEHVAIGRSLLEALKDCKDVTHALGELFFAMNLLAKAIADCERSQAELQHVELSLGVHGIDERRQR